MPRKYTIPKCAEDDRKNIMELASTQKDKFADKKELVAALLRQAIEVETQNLASLFMIKHYLLFVLQLFKQILQNKIYLYL